MLRYLGVPARYATGYSVSSDAFSRTSDGDYTAVILDRQAHAWAEVYLDGVGWIPVEMTPGATAFSGDNTMEQLQFAGQLSGAFEDETVPKPENIDASEENNNGEDGEEADGGTVKRQPGSSSGKKSTRRGALPDTNASGQTDSGTDDRSEGNVGAGDSSAISSGISVQPGGNTGTEDAVGDSSGTDTSQNTEFVLQKNKKTSKPKWELPSGVKAALKGIFGVCFGFFLCIATVYLIHRSCYWRLCRAENREKIFLIYRNLKLLLWVSGHSDGLNGQEADDFRMILEKSGFGEKGPSNQELRRAVHFYRKLAEEEYGRLPFYKKPVFKCFNVY